jgi:hypothetical protein
LMHEPTMHLNSSTSCQLCIGVVLQKAQTSISADFRVCSVRLRGPRRGCAAGEHGPVRALRGSGMRPQSKRCYTA